MKNDRIAHYSDERDSGKGLIVTLRHPFRFEKDGTHAKSFANWREAMQEVKNSKKCTCKTCTYTLTLSLYRPAQKSAKPKPPTAANYYFDDTQTKQWTFELIDDDGCIVYESKQYKTKPAAASAASRKLDAWTA